MSRFLLVALGAAIAGVLSALVAALIAAVTAGPLSPPAGGLIGVAFGIMSGSASRNRLPRGHHWAAAALRGAVAGVTAALTIYLLRHR